MRKWYGINSAGPELKPEITLCLKLPAGVTFSKVSRNMSSYLWFTTMCYRGTIRMIQCELNEPGVWARDNLLSDEHHVFRKMVT